MSGDMNGNLLILDARSGAVSFQTNTGVPLGRRVITYDVAGKQYIALAGGSISPIWPLPKATSRITIYVLR